MMWSVLVYSPDLNQTLPQWVPLLGCFAHFWYQTFDAIDGKHARNTNNCSPLGQLLDHNLDQISLMCSMLSICALLKVGDNVWKVLSLTPAVLSVHFSIEFRAHFTGLHVTSVGMIGATE